MEYEELKEIKLNKPCWVIHSVDDLIFVAVRSTEILVLDLVGNTVKTIPANQQNLIYLCFFEDLHFLSEIEEGCLCCYNSTGCKLWQFRNETTIVARNMCADSHGHLFVACQNSNSVVLISNDGKQSKVVVNVSEPKSVYFDTKNSTLYVCSLHGDHFSSYKILNR